MKILIADDSNLKQELIKNFLKSIIAEVEIIQTYAFNTSFLEIKKKKIDLILLDMTMPSFEKSPEKVDIENSLKTLAGQSIISKMSYRNINIPTIIVTQFEVFGRFNSITPIEEITKELMDLHPKIVKGSILFDVQTQVWQEQLQHMIKGITFDKNIVG